MNRPWMPLYVADYRADTAHLSAAQHGAYLLLIMHYWQTGGLPQDDGALSRIACMSAGEWRKNRLVVAAFFSEDWRHGRIDKEIVKAEVKQERRSEAGKRGGMASAKAKQNSSNAATIAQASSSLSQSERKEDSPADAGSSKYVFESGVIRLNQRDFEQWKQAFSHIELAAELLSLSEWAESLGKNWFHPVKGALNKRNREVKAEKDRQTDAGGFKWNGLEGVI